MSLFSENASFLIKKKGTVLQAANACGVTTRTINKWMAGDCHPPADKLVLLADFLGVSLDNIMRIDIPERVRTGENIIWKELA